MSKFNKQAAAPTAQSPMTTTGTTLTYEGGAAWTRDVRSELLLLAAVNMVGEDTFYEKAGARDDRFRNLVRQVAVQDPEWMVNFVKWLRTGANMRSASVVAAVEGVKARLDGRAKDDDRCMPDSFNARGINRQLIDAACARADEPGELLAYWTSRYGRTLPKPVKRGVADAVCRLYTERNLLKYDSASDGYRFGDVIELTHPQADPAKPWQGDLFKYALDRRHNRDNEIPGALRVLRNRDALTALTPEARRQLLGADNGAETLSSAGMTWESVAGWLQGPMDAAAWEAIIPSMGAMALVRNLRNFDQAGVSDDVAAKVCAKLSNPEDIRQSRMFPYRMFQAYRAAPSLRWGHALDKALDAACGNIPALEGKTLVLVDTSGSMNGHPSGKSNIRHVDIGALFGVALAAKGNDVDLYGFADGIFKFEMTKGGSVLKQVEAFTARVGEVGYGTRTAQAIAATLKPTHKRVVVITDGQAFGYGTSVSETVPPNIPLFGIDTTGYSKSSIDTSKPNRYEIGGFSDAMFSMLGLLASGKDAGWPWE